jgi:hypothetical protein
MLGGGLARWVGGLAVRGRGRAVGVLAATVGLFALLAALPVGSALADVTIGQTANTPAGWKGCPEGSLNIEPTYSVPRGGGTITSFSFWSDANNPGQVLEFLVLRPAGGGGSYTVVGTTSLVTLQGTGLEKFAANIPVHGGDILGLWNQTDLATCFNGAAGSVGVFGTTFASEPNVGDIFALPLFDGIVLNESAKLVPQNDNNQGQNNTQGENDNR